MTEKEAVVWFNRAPKEAQGYARATAAGYLAQRGAIYEPITYEAAGRDAFVMACALAIHFWPADS